MRTEDCSLKKTGDDLGDIALIGVGSILIGIALGWMAGVGIALVAIGIREVG
jgi:hypothetical protein